MKMTVTNLAQFTAAVERGRVVVISRMARLQQACGDIVFLELTIGGRYSPGTPIDTGNARSKWERKLQGAIEVFDNACAYIQALEFGHSKQAPIGFMRLVVLHWRDIVRDALAMVKAGTDRRSRGTVGMGAFAPLGFTPNG